MKSTVVRVDVTALERLPLTARSHTAQALNKCGVTCRFTPACHYTILIG